MPVTLPEPIAAYFQAANAADIDARLAAFDENARVKDEDQEYHGRSAIRAWMEDAARKYRYTVDVKEILEANNKTVVAGAGIGRFPR